jgi:hypothetical protein
MKLSFVTLLLLACAWTSAVHAQAPPPEPPAGLTAADHGWDDGTKVDLHWTPSPDAPDGIKKYMIYAAPDTGLAEGMVPPDSAFTAAGEAEAEADGATVEKLARGIPHVFRVTAMGLDNAESVPAVTTEAVVPTRQWFDGDRVYLFIVIFVFCGSVIFWIFHARAGRDIKVRKIAGLEAVDEAVGRATEMGRSCLFIAGIQDMNDIQTIAGLNVLGRVSRVAAEFDAKVEVPTSRSLVMTAAREVVQASYLSVGRPDAFNQDLIYYVTDEQFGFVAYIQGMMARERPAACFYMGAFFAESLILAEMGNTIGAIQVAGTAMPAQLPFFVAACDYTLIGEEFFAASAYLSGEPDQLGSLKGQDVGKIIVAVGIVVGVALATLANILGPESGLGSTFQHAVDYLRNEILT